jgi:hypothetical protein
VQKSNGGRKILNNNWFGKSGYIANKKLKICNKITGLGKEGKI